MPNDRPNVSPDISQNDPAGAALPVEAMAALFEGAFPCGPDLEYDPEFEAMQEAGAGKPERQYGDTVYPAEPPDWPTVRARARALVERTRDLRVVVWLLRSESRLGGLARAVDGLELLRLLLERHWPLLHPQLDPNDGNDPTARLNAIFPLHQEGGLADLRAASVTRGRGAATVRALELVFGRAEPLPGEAVPLEEPLLQQVMQAQAGNPGLAAAMQRGVAAALGIAQVLDSRLGAGSSPELGPLVALMQAVATAGLKAQVAANGTAGAADPLQGIPGQAWVPPASGGDIRSRADAIRALDRVCEWLEINEPTHPAPILIGRARRLLEKKSFLDVIRDLVPDGVRQIETLAGPPA